MSPEKSENKNQLLGRDSLLLGKNILECGKTNDTINTWIDSLNRQYVLNIRKLGGESNGNILNRYLKSCTQKQRARYFFIMQKQYDKLSNRLKQNH